MQNKIIYAFIDSQNVNLSIKDQGWILDLRRFRVYLKEKYGVKNVDAEIILHAMIEHDNYDKKFTMFTCA